MYIREQIREYERRVRLRFHTAGRLHPQDITEIDGLFPLSCVEDAERAVAEKYGVRHLRFLFNGSSIGVKAAILAVGKPILAEDVCHRAVDEGATLARVPVYKAVRERYDGLSVPLTASQVERSLREHPDVGAVLLTSPDYYGRCVRPEVYEAVRKHGKTLIVDSAHGAHFAFSPLFPPSPCTSADYCNMSAHKTLAAYTQTAYLAVNVDPAPVDRALCLLGTTSPSYLFAAALEEAADRASRADYERMKRAVDTIKARFAFAENDDFSRLVLDAKPFEMCGRDLYAQLLERGVAAEMSDLRYVVFIVTPDNADCLEELADILERIRER